MERIRTAILGYGRSGGTMHAGGVERNAAFEMTAVCDVDRERRAQAAARFGCAVYDDYRRMIEKERLDLVCVITRSDQHCEMTCDCLNAGLNVLVTKPWAVNETEAHRMVAAAAKARGLLMPWLPARWGSDLRRLKQLLAEKAIGDVFLVRRAVCTFATRDDWQTQQRYGGGYLRNWGPHIVDPPVLLLDSKVTSVYARMKQTINPGDTEDVFLAVMNLADGTIVQAEFTIAAEDLPSWFIQGTRGTIVVRERELTLRKKDPARPSDPTQHADMKASGEETLHETLKGDPYGDTDEIYTEIARAVRGEHPFPVTPAHALELTRLLDAIRTASEENRVVTL
jgi:predicted dehydrogenase